MHKLTVVANCHCLPIARTLALGTADAQAQFIDVNFTTQSPHAERIAALRSDDGTGIVYTFPFGPKWGALETSLLKAVYGARCTTFTNIHFTGLHPDLTYIGAMGARVTAVMGDYHSKLVLYAFVKGIGADDCIAMFNPATYERIGFFDFFAASAAELRGRDVECDVRFAEEFLALVRLMPALFTVNHPTDAVLQILCERLCAAQRIRFTPFPEAYLTNVLADNYIWPVYDEIAERHGLRYRTPQLFVSANRSESRGMTLETLVRAFYDSYAQLPGDEFSAMVRRLPFYDQFDAVLEGWNGRLA